MAGSDDTLALPGLPEARRGSRAPNPFSWMALWRTVTPISLSRSAISGPALSAMIRRAGSRDILKKPRRNSTKRCGTSRRKPVGRWRHSAGWHVEIVRGGGRDPRRDGFMAQAFAGGGIACFEKAFKGGRPINVVVCAINMRCRLAALDPVSLPRHDHGCIDACGQRRRGQCL